MSDRARVRAVIETRCSTSVAASHQNPIRLGFCLLFALLSLTPLWADAQDYELPAEAPNLPANLRPLIPRGWVATSFAEVDMNKDGNLDRAVLLTPNSDRNDRQGNIAGTPLKDRRRNLMLLVGQPSGRAPLPTYLPWSFHQSRFMNQAVPADFSDFYERSGKVSAFGGTLRFNWDFGEAESGQGTGTQTFRLEGQCLRLIGTDYNWFQGEDEYNNSLNFLTNTETHTRVFVEADRAGFSRRRKEGPQTSTIEDTGPICANHTPLVAAAVAPQVQQPQALLKQPTRPTSDAENRYRPPSPFAPRAECIVPPLPMVDSTAEAEGPFDRMMEMCGVSETEDDGSCQKPIRTIQLGSAITASIGELESSHLLLYSYLLLYAVDDCGLWVRELDLHWETDDRAEQAYPRPRDLPYEVRPWALEDLDHEQYFVVPTQADGSFYLDDQDAGFFGITFSGGLHIVPIERGGFRVTAVP